jgi:hypothetical protein
MAVRFKTTPLAMSDSAEEIVLEDIRELLFLMLHVLIAKPDTAGNQTQVRERLGRFIAGRMVDEE